MGTTEHTQCLARDKEASRDVVTPVCLSPEGGCSQRPHSRPRFSLSTPGSTTWSGCSRRVWGLPVPPALSSGSRGHRLLRCHQPRLQGSRASFRAPSCLDRSSPQSGPVFPPIWASLPSSSAAQTTGFLMFIRRAREFSVVGVCPGSHGVIVGAPHSPLMITCTISSYDQMSPKGHIALVEASRPPQPARLPHRLPPGPTCLTPDSGPMSQHQRWGLPLPPELSEQSPNYSEDTQSGPHPFY